MSKHIRLAQMPRLSIRREPTMVYCSLEEVPGRMCRPTLARHTMLYRSERTMTGLRYGAISHRTTPALLPARMLALCSSMPSPLRYSIVQALQTRRATSSSKASPQSATTPS